MALDIKRMIVGVFLELCERKELSKITIKDIQDKTGLSRQTFYNHFKDKDDLIQYCYDAVVTPEWKIDGEGMTKKYDDDYIRYMYEWRTEYLKSVRKYGRFMKMACALDGPNCLWRHMIDDNMKLDTGWHEAIFGAPLTEEMRAATEYHTYATMNMIIDWIMHDMPVSEEELTDIIMRNKTMSLAETLGGNADASPYIRMREIIKTNMSEAV